VITSPAGRATQGGTAVVGKVLSSTPLPNGLAIRQAVGKGQSTHGSPSPTTACSATRSELGAASKYPSRPQWQGRLAQEHFMVRRELNAGQGHRVYMRTFDDPATKHDADRSTQVAPWFVSTPTVRFPPRLRRPRHFDMRGAADDRLVVVNRFPRLRSNVVYGPALETSCCAYTATRSPGSARRRGRSARGFSSDYGAARRDPRYSRPQFSDAGSCSGLCLRLTVGSVAYNDFQSTWRRSARTHDRRGHLAGLRIDRAADEVHEEKWHEGELRDASS